MCQRQTLDDKLQILDPTDIAVDSKNDLHIVYRLRQGGAVAYASNAAGSWSETGWSTGLVGC